MFFLACVCQVSHGKKQLLLAAGDATVVVLDVVKPALVRALAAPAVARVAVVTLAPVVALLAQVLAQAVVAAVVAVLATKL